MQKVNIFQSDCMQLCIKEEQLLLCIVFKILIKSSNTF